MSKLEELIKEFCPNGVEYKKLGELGKFYGGLSGKSKNDFTNGNEKFITYKNVYANPSLNLDIEDRVKINPGERQNTLQYGDIIFTGSSETPDECGFSSVITTKTSEKLYLNSFCFFFRLDNQSILLPDFAKHLFRAESIRYQIGKTASGVTRYNVSKDKMKQVQIPLPALPVQREIVRILDCFTLYSAELTAELTARRKQYEFYRDKLLGIEQLKIQWEKLGNIYDVRDGTHDSPKPQTIGHFLVTSKNIKDGKVNFDGCYFISDEDYESINKRSRVDINDLLFTMIGTIGEIALVETAPNYAVKNVAIIKTKSYLISKFLYYFLQSNTAKKYIENNKSKGSQSFISLGNLRDMSIPVPPMDVQERIVKVLDNFDAICSDLGIGLPAEIEKRQKQYEYYRDKLLNFKDIEEDGEKETKAKGTGKN